MDASASVPLADQMQQIRSSIDTAAADEFHDALSSPLAPATPLSMASPIAPPPPPAQYVMFPRLSADHGQPPSSSSAASAATSTIATATARTHRHQSHRKHHHNHHGRRTRDGHAADDEHSDGGGAVVSSSDSDDDDDDDDDDDVDDEDDDDTGETDPRLNALADSLLHQLAETDVDGDVHEQLGVLADSLLLQLEAGFMTSTDDDAGVETAATTSDLDSDSDSDSDLDSDDDDVDDGMYGVRVHDEDDDDDDLNQPAEEEILTDSDLSVASSRASLSDRSDDDSDLDLNNGAAAAVAKTPLGAAAKAATSMPTPTSTATATASERDAMPSPGTSDTTCTPASDAVVPPVSMTLTPASTATAATAAAATSASAPHLGFAPYGNEFFTPVAGPKFPIDLTLAARGAPTSPTWNNNSTSTAPMLKTSASAPDPSSLGLYASGLASSLDRTPHHHGPGTPMRPRTPSLPILPSASVFIPPSMTPSSTTGADAASDGTLIPLPTADGIWPGHRSARITGYEIRDDRVRNKKYTAYCVTVVSPLAGGSAAAWTLWKRYSEFFELDTRMSKDFSTVRFPTFPPKRLFGSSIAEPLIHTRSTKINRYLAFVFSERVLRESLPVTEFFAFDVHEMGGSSHDTVTAGTLPSSSSSAVPVPPLQYMPLATVSEPAHSPRDRSETSSSVMPGSFPSGSPPEFAHTITALSLKREDGALYDGAHPRANATVDFAFDPADVSDGDDGDGKGGKSDGAKKKKKGLSQVKHQTSKIIRKVGRAYSNVETAVVAGITGNGAAAAAAAAAASAHDPLLISDGDGHLMSPTHPPLYALLSVADAKVAKKADRKKSSKRSSSKKQAAEDAEKGYLSDTAAVSGSFKASSLDADATAMQLRGTVSDDEYGGSGSPHTPAAASAASSGDHAHQHHPNAAANNPLSPSLGPKARAKLMTALAGMLPPPLLMRQSSSNKSATLDRMPDGSMPEYSAATPNGAHLPPVIGSNGLGATAGGSALGPDGALLSPHSALSLSTGADGRTPTSAMSSPVPPGGSAPPMTFAEAVAVRREKQLRKKELKDEKAARKAELATKLKGEKAARKAALRALEDAQIKQAEAARIREKLERTERKRLKKLAKQAAAAAAAADDSHLPFLPQYPQSPTDVAAGTDADPSGATTGAAAAAVNRALAGGRGYAAEMGLSPTAATQDEDNAISALAASLARKRRRHFNLPLFKLRDALSGGDGDSGSGHTDGASSRVKRGLGALLSPPGSHKSTPPASVSIVSSPTHGSGPVAQLPEMLPGPPPLSPGRMSSLLEQEQRMSMEHVTPTATEHPGYLHLTTSDSFDANDTGAGAGAGAGAGEDADSIMVPGVEEVSTFRAKICLDDFQLLKLIGKGTFGKVLLAKHKTTGRPCAIKVIPKAVLKNHPNEIRHVMSERNVLMRNMKHPFLVGLQYAFQTPIKLYLVLDYVNGGELFFHLQRERRFSEDRVRFYAAEITSALEYLHGLGIMYRDLKPENILLDRDGHIALTDFGLAKENIEPAVGRTSTFCGTPEYLAPEIVKRQPYTLAVDWWCLGSVVYEMLVGLPPFFSTNTQELFQRILHDKLRWPAHIPVSAAARGFVAALLVRQPELRLGWSGAYEVRSHPFYTGVDWYKLVNKLYRPPFVPDLESTLDLRYIDPTFKDEDIHGGSLAAEQRASAAAASTPPSSKKKKKSTTAAPAKPKVMPWDKVAKAAAKRRSKDSNETVRAALSSVSTTASSATTPRADQALRAGSAASAGRLSLLRETLVEDSDDDAFAGFTYYGGGADDDVLRDVHGDDADAANDDDGEVDGDRTPQPGSAVSESPLGTAAGADTDDTPAPGSYRDNLAV